MKKIKFFNILLAGLLGLSSCSDFLDKVPDNRVEINTPEQIKLLLVNGYSYANYAVLAELSSDNMEDNNAPDANGVRYNLTSYDKMNDETFAWEDSKSSSDGDSPTMVWDGAYHAIAVANHALEAIEKLKAEGRGEEVKALEGEALLIRAYNHFVLVNMFAHSYRNAELSKTDLAIPYVTEPERTIHVDYERLSVAEVYDFIEKDLLAGLPLINDNLYIQPKYHFNRKAACAFAARFYLFKREYKEAEKWATEALGGEGADPAGLMRRWDVSYANFDALVQGYISTTSANNFLIIPTNSQWWRVYGTGHRYAVIRDAAASTLMGQGPTWSNFNLHPCYSGKLYVNGTQEYGVYFPKAGELFEYTDKTAGIGYTHVVRCEFTAEETILTRAEARLYLNDINGAIEDLRIWDESRQKNGTPYELPTLSSSNILKFYVPSRTAIVKPLNIDKWAPSDTYSVSPEIEPYLQCVLHFRRIETIFDGYRWFDIKRYGIEVTHKIGKSRVETLTFDDPRRALQLPAEVIAAGMKPTNRSRIVKPEGEPIKLNKSVITINE